LLNFTRFARFLWVSSRSVQSCRSCLFYLNLEHNELTSVFSSLANLMHLRVLNISQNNNLTVDDLPKPPLHASIKQLTDLTLVPNESLTRNELDFELAIRDLVGELSGLTTFNDVTFERKMIVSVSNLASLQHHIAADDHNTKDSATCSCVEGNACIR